jgi:type II secretory pathway component PulF
LLSALDDAAESMSDPVARDETARIRARVREGMALQDALAEGALFPKLLAQLVGVGVESGQVPEFLHKAAEIFEENTDRAVQRAVALAEPAMIVVFGSIVAVVALALLQAIYSVNPGAF